MSSLVSFAQVKNCTRLGDTPAGCYVCGLLPYDLPPAEGCTLLCILVLNKYCLRLGPWCLLGTLAQYLQPVWLAVCVILLIMLAPYIACSNDVNQTNHLCFMQKRHCSGRQ